MTSKKKTTKTTKRKKKLPLANKIANLPRVEDMKTFVVDEEETIVEKVFNERNLITTPAMEQTAPIHHETQLGTVRIEGEVTPQKLALAKQFEQVFAASVDEIMGLASMTPNSETMDFVKSSGLTTKQVEEMKNAAPWTTFQIKGETLLKTTDNKIENVKFYFYRLERAVINQINLRKQAEEDAKQARLELAEATADVAKLNKRIEKIANDIKAGVFNQSFASKMFLSVRNVCSSIYQTVLNLLK
jgi:DNA-directed RNA polymerase subunit L